MITVMAYVEAFIFDVFISYAREDEGVWPGRQEGWASHFFRDLQIALNQQVGRRTTIFFDRPSSSEPAPIEYVEDNIRNSAVFVPVISPAYATSTRARWELWRFIRDSRSLTGIAPIERIAPIEVAEVKRVSYPPSAPTPIRFWITEGGRERRVSSETDPQQYSLLLARLANEIVRRLRDLSDALEMEVAEKPAKYLRSGPASRPVPAENHLLALDALMALVKGTERLPSQSGPNTTPSESER
jgi:hypothetical protein